MRSLPVTNHPTSRPMFESFSDGYVVEDLLVFGGPVGGHTSMGFWIEVPDLQSASNAVCNQFQEVFSTGLCQLPEGWSMDVRFSQDRGYSARLAEYQSLTAKCHNPTARLLRNANFIRHWQHLESGALRRKRVTLHVSCPLYGSAKPFWRPSLAEGHYNTLLAQARSALRNWAEALNHPLRTIGGHLLPMDRADHARVWSDAFNPSFSERLDYDPAAAFDTRSSLLENCWHSELRGRGSEGFLLDDWPHGTLCLKRPPAATHARILLPLTHLPFGDFTITVRLRRLPKEQVLKRYESSLGRLHQQLRHHPNERQSVGLEQLTEKVRRVSTNEAVPFEFAFVIVVRAKTPAALAARLSALKNAVLGMNGAQYYAAALPASARNHFASSLPGLMRQSRGIFTLYGENRYLADLLPICSSFTGHPGCPESLASGTDGNVVNVVTFLGEGATATPQNLIILGAPGMGKSVVLTHHLLETDHHYGFTAIVESGLSHAPYTRSCGIEPIVFQTDGLQTLNPFDTQFLPWSSFHQATLTAFVSNAVGIPADEDRALRQRALINKHLDRLRAERAQDHLRHLTAPQREALIRRALACHTWAHRHQLSDIEAFLEFRDLERRQPQEAEALVTNFSTSALWEFEQRHPSKVQNLVFAQLQPAEHLTVSAFQEYLLLAEEDIEECRSLATLLKLWCRGGPHGNPFDAASNVSLTGPVVHFELGLIPEAARDIRRVVGFLILNGLRHHILSLPRLMRKRLVIEEVSRFLEVPGSEAILRALFESFRHTNTQVTVVGQSYSRIADTSIRVALVGNTRAWMIFNTGDRQDVERLGQDLGLSRASIESILRFVRPDPLSAHPYSEYLYYHTHEHQPVCGTVRHVMLPHDLPRPSSVTPTP